MIWKRLDKGNFLSKYGDSLKEKDVFQQKEDDVIPILLPKFNLQSSF